MYSTSLASFILSLSIIGCAPSTELTELEAGKIDPRLKPVLEGKAPGMGGCGTQQLPDGSPGYRVIIRGDAVALRDAGILVTGEVGDVVTATLSKAQIVKAAKLSSVRSIDCGSTNTPQ